MGHKFAKYLLHEKIILTMPKFEYCDEHENCHIPFTDGSDYIGTRFLVTILPGQDTAIVKVPIIDDLVYEPYTEFFTVELEIPPESAAMHVVSGSRYPMFVYIEDDDG